MAASGFANVHPHFNAEDAANAAVEFVGSLDNLPSEVTYLLGEIAEKDAKINHLLGRIHQRHYGLTKNIKHIASQPPSGTSTPTASFPLPIPAGQPLPIGQLPPKDQQVMQKIQGEWTKVEQYQLDKIKLATRLEAIISRARERGQAEWRKVGGMDLDEIEKQDGKTLFGELGGSEVLLPSSGLGPGSDGRPLKKRKPNVLPLPLPGQTTPQIVHPPAAAMPPPPAPSRPSLSARGSRHGRHVSSSTLSEDADADGEADVGDGDGETEADDTLYCFCQKKSYGEMIGCDNEKCEYEWFHVTCVSMQGIPLPETWYCPVCVKTLGLLSSDGTRAGGQRGQKARKR